MAVDIDIAHVARLARLALDDDTLERLGGELAGILEHAATVGAVDTTGLEPTAHPLGIRNRLRDDVIGASLPREEALAAAPDHDDAYFRVPPALEQ